VDERGAPGGPVGEHRLDGTDPGWVTWRAATAAELVADRVPIEASVDRRVESNRRWWDQMVPIHAASPFYDVERFRAGGLSLDEIERGEVGDVRGQSLLHLQCHFGLGTLSWARLGARVTGVDYSAPAIELARRLAAELGLEARFLCSDLYELPDRLQERFDVVFTSYGVLTWLPDLARWGETVAGLLRPGGRLHLVELHPFAGMFDDETTEVRLRYPYFRGAEAIRIERPGSYAAPAAPTDLQVTYSWPAPVSAVLGALVDAGLRIESFREFGSCGEQLRPWLVLGPDGRWTAPPGWPAVPLLYALRARAG
jgi:2-polyprenyl-3-methyl-5-hydroxy-6-metoxy-1,4-benzoquinol methylase